MLAQLVTSKEFPSLLCSYQDQKQKVQWQLAKKKKKKKKWGKKLVMWELSNYFLYPNIP